MKRLRRLTLAEKRAGLKHSVQIRTAPRLLEAPTITEIRGDYVVLTRGETILTLHWEDVPRAAWEALGAVPWWLPDWVRE